MERRTEYSYPRWHLVFRWCRLHRVTGVELIHGPLLLWFGMLLALMQTNLLGASPVYLGMDRFAPIPFWAVSPLSICVLKLFAILNKWMRLLQVSLAMAASWWLLVALTLAFSGFYLAAAPFITLTVVAFWRIADLDVQNGGD